MSSNRGGPVRGSETHAGSEAGNGFLWSLACEAALSRADSQSLRGSGQHNTYLGWLGDREDSAGALSDQTGSDWAVRDYKRFLKKERLQSPASVNQALAAIDNFYRSRNMGRPSVKREPLPVVPENWRVCAEQERRRHASPPCLESSTALWRPLLGSLSVPDDRKTSRSSCYATSSEYCDDKSTGPPSTTAIGTF